MAPLRLTLTMLLVLAASPRLVAAQEGLPAPAPGPRADYHTAAEAHGAGAQNRPFSRGDVSYALGLRIGGDLRGDSIDVDAARLVTGITDALNGNRPKMDRQSIVAALDQLQRQLRQKADARVTKEAKQNVRKARAFLAENRQREQVTETDSGLQFEVLESGSGSSPTPADTVLVHYKGTLIDGTEFDKSRKGKPASIPLDQVIPAWQEALPQMRVRDRWRLFVPPELGYGLRPPAPPIEPGSLLIFDIELVGIE